MLMFPNGLILPRWSLREALYLRIFVCGLTQLVLEVKWILLTHIHRDWDVTRISCKLQTPERRVQRRIKLQRDAVYKMISKNLLKHHKSNNDNNISASYIWKVVIIIVIIMNMI